VGAPIIEVIDKHRAGVFTAAIGGRRGRGAKTLYSQDQVEAWRARASREDIALGKEARRHFTGEEARKCFRLFLEGKGTAECVSEFGIHPLTVEAIYASWKQTKGELHVSAAALAKIQLLTLDGPLPITCESDLVEVLEIAARGNEPQPCGLCNKGERLACRRCVAKLKAKAAAPVQAPPLPLSEDEDEEG
jgi:hypothetical protein